MVDLYMNDTVTYYTSHGLWCPTLYFKTNAQFAAPFRAVWRISSGVRRKGPYSRAVPPTALFGFGTPGAGEVLSIVQSDSCTFKPWYLIPPTHHHHRNGPQITWTAHPQDVNVISWNKSVGYLLASGSDDGTFKVGDLHAEWHMWSRQ